MKKIKLYVAISLDGKISKLDGDVKWLEEIPNPQKFDYGYAAFYESVDTTLMGNNCYQQILSFGVDFPYPTTRNFVLTRNKNLKDTKDVSFLSGAVLDFIQELKTQEGKDIWLIGGAQINSLLWEAKLIDEILLFVMPIIIGNGIPLFEDMQVEQQMTLEETKQYENGVVMLKYMRPN